MMTRKHKNNMMSICQQRASIMQKLMLSILNDKALQLDFYKDQREIPPLGATNFFIQKPAKSPQLYLKQFEMQHKTCNTDNTNTNSSQKMAAIAPVALGTRGTVGSLIRREIEYFSKFEIARCASFRKPQEHVVDIASTSGHSRHSFWFMIMRWKRKKRRGSSGILPNICSAVEVADRNRLSGIPGFTYRILKNDVNNLQI